MTTFKGPAAPLSAQQRTAMTSSIRPVVISGPSGSGKSTLQTRLFKEFPNCFSLSVSHTSRSPREGEVNGKDYHFVTVEKFEQLKADNGFLEHVQFSENHYGTSRKSLDDAIASGNIPVSIVDVSGVKSFKDAGVTPTPRFIFIQPPSMGALRSRLQGRGTETEESLQKRLDTAQEALDYAAQPGSYDHIIVNDSVDDAYNQLKVILMADIKVLQEAKQALL